MSDDLFDSLLHLEEHFVQQGIESGRQHAEQAAYRSGFELGQKKGSEIGEELGYYFGCVTLWLELANKHPDLFAGKRVLPTLMKLQQLICTFSSDPTKEELFDDLENIRAKFKHLAALLKVKQRPPLSTAPSSTNGKLNF